MAGATSKTDSNLEDAEITDPLIVKSNTGIVGLSKGGAFASGTTCDMFEAHLKHAPHKRFAIKAFRTDKEKGKELHAELFEREASILQGVTHPHIIKIFAAVECPKYYAIVLELCQRGDLIDFTEKLTAQEASRYALQITWAIHYLHSFRIVHGDLKVQNILVDQNNKAKLCDFGQARVLPKGNDMVKTWGGTQLYVAPEWKTNSIVDAFKMDTYAFGVVLWVLFSNDESVCMITPAMLDELNLPEPYSGCLRLLLKENPNKRAGMPQISFHLKKHLDSPRDQGTDKDDKEKQKEEEMD